MEFLHSFLCFFFFLLFWLTTGWRGGRKGGRGEACRALGVLMGQLGGSAGGGILSGMWLGFSNGIHDAVRICVPLVSSESSICHSPCFFLPANHIVHNSVLWMVWQRNGPLWQPPYSWKAGCSPTLFLSHRRYHEPKKIFFGPSLCHLGEKWHG